MNVTYDEVSGRLKEEREHNGWTQEDICKRIYMTQGHYSKAEAGKNYFTHIELQNLLKADMDLHFVYTNERISHNEYYDFLKQCDRQQILCLAEIALPLIVNYSQELPWEKADSLRQRIKYIKCMLNKDKTENSHYFQLRRFKAYSQEYMANLLGVNKKTYNSLEQQKNFCNSYMLLQMYNQFQVSPLILMNDKMGLAREICSLLEQLKDSAGQSIFDYLKYGYEQFWMR